MTDRMRLLFGACLTALLATELVRGPVVHLMKQRIIEYTV